MQKHTEFIIMLYRLINTYPLQMYFEKYSSFVTIELNILNIFLDSIDFLTIHLYYFRDLK